MDEQIKENAIAIKYNKDFYVIQANELVRSKQDDLSLLEAKLIRLAITQVAIHSICCLCFARGGRSRTTSWVGLVARFALFFFLLNLPEAAGWVSDSSSTFPNVENRMEIVGEHWQLSLPNRPLGNLTEFVQFLSGASIVGAFYVSAWLSLRERESLK